MKLDIPARFKKEQQMTQLVQGPGVVNLLECFEQDEVPFMVWVFLDEVADLVLRRLNVWREICSP